MLREMVALALLASAAAQVTALTLGPAQGKAVIGHPLDLLVMVEADGSAQEAEQCLLAEVSYGESRLPAADVTATRLANRPSGWRIRTRLPVNEPLVTLQLRLGCVSTHSRSYVLLADQDESLQAVSGTGPLARSRIVADAPDAGLTPAPVRLPAARPRPPGVERLPAKSRPRPEPAAAKPVIGQLAGATIQQALPHRLGPRLELELLEHEAVVTAADSNQVAAVPASNAAGQTVGRSGHQPAAAAQDLASELQALRAEQARSRAVVEALQRQLAESRQPRWQDPLVLALLGLGSASWLALALSWIRLRRQRWA